MTQQSPPPIATPVDSPCKGVCAVNPLAGLCIGCFRRIDEITHWVDMSETERDAIRNELPAREAAFRAQMDAE